MPTGYTAPVVDGETYQARDYIGQCARAFGAFMHQRDESSSAAPREPEISSSYFKYAANAEAELTRLKTWTPERIETEHAEYVKKVEERNRKAQREYDQTKARIEFMLKQVREWQPNEQAQPIKEFAIKQLEETMRFDCGNGPYLSEIESDSQKWHAESLAFAEKEATYYREKMEEGIRLQIERQAYARAVLDSIAQIAEVQHP